MSRGVAVAFQANIQLGCRTFAAPARSLSRPAMRLRVTLDTAALRSRVTFVLSLLCDHPSSVNVRFCDDDEMRSVNGSFRGKDSATDVLSFPAPPGSSDTMRRGRPLTALGDVLVCLPVCVSQARSRGIDVAREVDTMLIHGLAHLKGLDHERGDAAWRVMSALEKALAKETNLALGVPCYLVIGERP